MTELIHAFGKLSQDTQLALIGAVVLVILWIVFWVS